MTEKEIIEALKQNEKPFGLMSKEMQDFVETHKEDGIWLSFSQTGGWIRITNLMLYSNCTYRLRPDYEEQPEVVKWPVDLHTDKKLLCAWNPDGANISRSFEFCISLPDFIGFLYEDGIISTSTRRYKQPDSMVVFCVHKDRYGMMKHEALTPTHVLFKGK